MQGGLEPGESVMGLGMLRRPTLFNVMGIPQKYDDYLAVATDRRLIVFETETGFSILMPTPKPVARNPIVWRYEELQTVRTGAVEGVVIHSGGAGQWIALVPHAYCGPLADEQEPANITTGPARRYDIYAQIDGIDGQRGLYAQYPKWLSERVNAGAFPLPPHKRAEVEAKIAHQRAIQIAEQERRIRAAAERDAKMKAAWAAFKPYLVPAIMVLVGLALVPPGALFALDGFERWDNSSDGVAYFEAKTALLKRDQKSWVADPKLAPPSDCPEEKLPYFIDSRSRSDDRTCHNCTERPAHRSQPYPGGRSFPRGDKVWDCPAPDGYAFMIKITESDLEQQESNAVQGLIRLAVGAAGAIVGIVVLALGGVFAAKKRKALTAAGPAGSPGAAPPGAPVLGAPGAPG